jgi:hypothetical protein
MFKNFFQSFIKTINLLFNKLKVFLIKKTPSFDQKIKIFSSYFSIGLQNKTLIFEKIVHHLIPFFNGFVRLKNIFIKGFNLTIVMGEKIIQFFKTFLNWSRLQKTLFQKKIQPKVDVFKKYWQKLCFIIAVIRFINFHIIKWFFIFMVCNDDIYLHASSKWL